MVLRCPCPSHTLIFDIISFLIVFICPPSRPREAPKMPQDTPNPTRCLDDVTISRQEASQVPPMFPQDSPRYFQDALAMLHNAPRCTQDGPKSYPYHPYPPHPAASGRILLVTHSYSQEALLFAYVLWGGFDRSRIGDTELFRQVNSPDPGSRRPGHSRLRCKSLQMI